MATLGKQIFTPPALWYPIAATSGNELASSRNASIVIPAGGWLTRFGVWAEKVSGDPKVYLVAWEQNIDGTPGELMGRTDLITVSTTGANNEGPVTSSKTEVQSAIRVAAGEVISIGLKLQDGDIRVGQEADPYLLYRRTVAGGLPSDPFITAIGGPIGGLAIYAVYIDNESPYPPINMTPADGAASNDLTPTLTGGFSDVDELTPTFDQMWAYEYEVFNNATDALLWGGPTAFFVATDEERADKVFARPYNGTALLGSEVLRWRARSYDLVGAPGDWSAFRTLTINQNARIVMTAPTGKIDGPSELIGWAGTYAHPAALTSQQMQVMVTKDDQLYREGVPFAKVVASPGGTATAFTVPSATDGDVGVLGAGLDFKAHIRAMANNIWGLYSTGIPFRTNAIPAVPSDLQPPSGTASTQRPTFRFKTIDPDDVEGTECTFEVQMIRPDLVTVTHPTALYDAVNNEGYLAGDVANMPMVGLYLWRARAKDISASDGISEWSDYAQFIYQAGLGVTITTPIQGGVIANVTPEVTFSIATGTQTHRRLQLFVPGGSAPIYDTLVETSAAPTFFLPATSVINGESYEVAVWARNNLLEEGWSLRRKFSITFTAPDGVAAPVLTTYAFPGDPEPTSVLFSWSIAPLPIDQFGGYVVRRRFSGEAFKDADVLKVIDNIAQNRWLDANAPADEILIYSVSILKKIAGQTVESAPVEADIDYDLSVVVIHAVDDPSERCILRWKPARRRGLYEQDATTYDTWGGEGLPIVMFGPGDAQSIIEAQFTILGDEYGEREDHFNAGESLYLQKRSIMYRDSRTHFFGLIRKFEYEQFDFKDTVTLRIEETDFLEGHEIETSPVRRREVRHEQRQKRKERRHKRRHHRKERRKDRRQEKRRGHHNN